METVLSGTKAMSQRAAAVLAGAWIGLAACAGLLGAALLVFRPGALG